jgi:hypothetical protein
MLKERTVEVQKQLLLGNAPYTRSRGTCYVCCDVMQQQKSMLQEAFSVGLRRAHCYATVW